MRLVLTSLLAAIALSLSGRAVAGLNGEVVAYYPFSGDADNQSGNGDDGETFDVLPTPDGFWHVERAFWFDGWEESSFPEELNGNWYSDYDGSWQWGIYDSTTIRTFNRFFDVHVTYVRS